MAVSAAIWTRVRDRACPYLIYWAWNAAIPDEVSWLVHVPCGLFVNRPATHWAAAEAPSIEQLKEGIRRDR